MPQKVLFNLIFISIQLQKCTGRKGLRDIWKKLNRKRGKNHLPLSISMVHRINYVYSGDLLTLDYPSRILWKQNIIHWLILYLQVFFSVCISSFPRPIHFPLCIDIWKGVKSWDNKSTIIWVPNDTAYNNWKVIPSFLEGKISSKLAYNNIFV